MHLSLYLDGAQFNVEANFFTCGVDSYVSFGVIVSVLLGVDEGVCDKFVARKNPSSN